MNCYLWSCTSLSSTITSIGPRLQKIEYSKVATLRIRPCVLSRRLSLLLLDEEDEEEDAARDDREKEEDQPRLRLTSSSRTFLETSGSENLRR